MSLGKSVARIGKLSSVYLIGSIIPMIVGFALMPVFTRYLYTEQMGIVNLSARIMGPVSILIQLGVLYSLKSHFFRMEASARPQVIKTVLVGQIVQAGLICVVLSVAGIWISGAMMPNLPLSPKMVLGLWLIVIWGCFFFSLMRVGTMLMQLLERAVACVSLKLLKYGLQVGLGLVAVVWLGWGGLGRQQAIFAATVVAGAVAVVLVKRCSGGGRFDLATYKRMLATGISFIPHTLAASLSLSINAWLLNKLVTASALGVYGIALAFAQLMEFPLASFNNAAYPTLAGLMSDGGREARRHQSRLYTLLISGFAVLTLGVAMFAPILIKILAHARYHEAALVVPVLTVAYLFQGFYVVAGVPVFYVGGGLWLAAATLSGLLVNVVLAFLLIPRYGMYGAALAVVGCFATRFAVIAVVGQRKYPLPWQVGAIFRALAAAGVLAAVDFFVAPRLAFLPAFGLKVLLLLAVAPLMWALGVVNTREVAWLRRLVAEKTRSLLKRPRS